MHHMHTFDAVWLVIAPLFWLPLILPEKSINENLYAIYDIQAQDLLYITFGKNEGITYCW